MTAPSLLRWCQSVTLAAGVVLAGAGGYWAYRVWTEPPAASGSVTAACTAGAFSFRAHAYYESDGRRWRIDHYLYRIRGGDGRAGGLFLGNARGRFSNVNVDIVKNGRTVASHDSPDDRESDVLYREAAGTGADVDRSDPTFVRFEAIFDEASGLLDFGPDPRCTATSPLLPVAR